MNKKTTMSEIAMELGLSRLTVSSVVNGKAHERGISVKTAERIEQHLARRGYVRSRTALSLRDRKTKCVGILHCGHLYSHLIEAFNGLVEHFADDAASLEIMVVPADKSVEGVKELISRGVTDLVWIYSAAEIREKELSELLPYLSNIKTIIYNFRFGFSLLQKELVEAGCYLVGIDRLKGDKVLAGFLKRLGHTNIVLPDYREERPFVRAGIQIVTMPRTRHKQGASMRQKGSVFAKQIYSLLSKRKITAACFHDDEIAGYAMTDLIDMGIRIPENLTVTGFDGLPVCEAFAVPLTTLSVPVSRLVKRVISIIHTHPDMHTYSCAPALIQRRSHASIH